MFDVEGTLRELERGDLVVKYPWLGWGIRGVEVTQAVQYDESSRPFTDPADRQPDNSPTRPPTRTCSRA